MKVSPDDVPPLTAGGGGQLAFCWPTSLKVEFVFAPK